ncbi:AsmA family protein [Aristophania vespae]|uniref:AsmA family protein n=1 Tax=Aristophania vespae TaxID=2697033 RepID=A0A6P1NF87_9PROT|nr:AsmA-like C-terminal region-containing protein [Aristophania vespae]QHI95230.1 AsmA family protein [Aristophania vespae]
MSFLALFHREIALQDFTAEGANANFSTSPNQKCSSWFDVAGYKNANISDGPDLKDKAKDSTPWKVSFDSLRLKNTQLKWDNGDIKTEKLQGSVFIERLDLAALTSASPSINLKASRDNVPFTLIGHLGPLKDIFASLPTRPWAFSVGLNFGPDQKNDHVTIDGTMRDFPRLDKALFTLQGHIDNLQDWQALFPDRHFGDVRNISGKISLKFSEAAQEALPYSTYMKFMGYDLNPVAVALKLGEVNLPDAALKAHDIEFMAEGSSVPLRIEAALELGKSSWQMLANLGDFAQIMSLLHGEDEAQIPLDVQLRERALLSKQTSPNKVSEGVNSQGNFQLHAKGVLGLGTSQISFNGEGKAFKFPQLSLLPEFLNNIVTDTTFHDVALQSDLKLEDLSAKGQLAAASLQNIKFKSRELEGEGEIALSQLSLKQPRYDVHLHFKTIDGNSFLSSSEASKETVEKSHSVRKNMNQAQNKNLFFKNLRYLSKGWDGLLDVKSDHFTLGPLIYDNVAFYALMGGDKITVDPISAQFGDTPLRARFSYNNTSEAPLLHVSTGSFVLPASLLLESFHKPSFIEGNMWLDGHIEAQGESWPSIMSSLKGPVDISLIDGKIKKSFLAPLAGPAAPLLTLGKPTLKLHCALGSMKFLNGIADFNSIVFQTKHYAMQGRGKVDLNENSLDLVINPHLNAIDREVSASMEVTGSWSHPRITALRNKEGYFQLDLGKAGSDNDPCSNAYKKAHTGHEVPALGPQSEPKKGNIKDILKSLDIGGKL